MDPRDSAASAARHPDLRPVDDRLLVGVGYLFRMATVAGLGLFGSYIALRAAGATGENFGQWQNLLAGRPMPTASDWISNVGIGVHFFMGAVLVLAWPLLLSDRIRARYRAVHRWTGRTYVLAGFLAGAGGLSFILTRGTYSQAAGFAFGLWGAVMMVCAVMAFVHARAKRFDRHRAWAIRLFATVMGSWLFDIELQVWKGLTGGLGMHPDGASGPFDLAILLLFFVPNLLVAEFFIRRLHRRAVLPSHLRWPVVVVLTGAVAAFVYAIGTLSATSSGKFGKHLWPLLGGG